MPVGGKPPTALSLSSLGEAVFHQGIVNLTSHCRGGETLGEALRSRALQKVWPRKPSIPVGLS